MATSIFDKYKATSTKVMKKLMDEEDSATSSGKFSNRLELSDGLNKVRFGPRHPGEESFMHMRACHWITIEVDNQPARRTVGNARVHLGVEQDPVEFYVENAKNKLSTGEAEDTEKLKNLTAWKGGMNLSTTWWSYAKFIEKEKRGPWEIFEYKRSVRDELKNQMIVEDEDESIETDCVSGPTDGRCALITYNSKAKQAKDYYKLKLSDKITKLTEEEMQAYDKLIPISKLPEFNYSIADYELAIEGLKYYDEANEIGLFEDADFLEELKGIKTAIKKQLGGATTDGKEADEDVDIDELPFEEDEGDKFTAMDRKALIAYKAEQGYDIKLLKTDSDDDMRNKLREQENEAEEEEEKSAKALPKPGKLDLATIKAQLESKKKK